MKNKQSWFLGTIGFSYKDWVGPFYPTGTPQKGYLSYYSKICNSVELNTTFHSIPRQSVVRSWAELTSPDFKFSLKAPRRITHELLLQNSEGLMSEFIDSIQPLGKKIGPILIQLPPKFTQNHFYVLENFLKSLTQNVRFAVEFRNKSWYNDITRSLLENYEICWVANDYPHLPKEITPTTDFLYIRWIGVNNLYHHHSYERVDKTSELNLWLEKIDNAAENMSSIFGYFNNDYAGYAIGTYLKFIKVAGFSDLGEREVHQGSFLE